jgi:hypothetical protein
MSRQVDESKHERWQRLLREQKSSGESVAGFCAQRRIPVHQFYWWQRRLRTESVKDHEAAKRNGTFVPVRVSRIGATAPIEIVHRHGHVIRVQDATSLRQVLQVLDDRSPTAEV